MKLLKEPLVHFVIAGGLLFAADVLLNRDRPVIEEVEPIRIGDGEVRWLRETFAKQWQRSPSQEELSELVTNLVEEELLAREARSLGLDQGDTIVRRRLAQKLEFLIGDTTQLVDPTETELRDFYSANPNRFRTEPRVSMSQIFFSTERRPHAEADARAALVKVAATGQSDGPTSLGDSLLLEERFDSIDRQSLANLFGVEFADAVFGLAPGSWHGPIRSSYGLHLVQVKHAEAAEVRSFEAARASVEQEWRHDREKQMKAAYLARLREKYNVIAADNIKPLLPADATSGAEQRTVLE
jgi:PPIC-type PPIASE domain